MAIVNGTEFEFIDLQSNSGGNTTRHMLRDAEGRRRTLALFDRLSDVTAKMRQIVSDNLCRGDDTVTSGYMAPDGKTYTSANYVYTDHLPVSEGWVIRAYNTASGTFTQRILRFVTAFDASGNVVSASGVGGDGVWNYTVPSGIASIVLSLPVGTNYMVTVNQTVTAYAAYNGYYMATEDFLGDVYAQQFAAKVDKNGVKQVTADNLADLTKTSQTVESGNIFPQASLLAEGKYVDIGAQSQKLLLRDNANYDSYIIAVNGGVYSLSGFRFVLLLASDQETPVGTVKSSPSTIDTEGAAYMALSFDTRTYSTDTVSISTQMPLYELPPNWKPTYSEGEAQEKSNIVSVSGSLADGGTLEIAGRSALKDGELIAFKAMITAFGSLRLNFTTGSTVTNYIDVDGTNITIKNNNATPTPAAHGLTIQHDLALTVQFANGRAKIALYSDGGMYTERVDWYQRGGTCSQPQIVSTGTVATEATLEIVYQSVKRGIWWFGDSYVSMGDPARWPYYLVADGYDKTIMLNGSPGMTSGGAMISFNALIQYGTPKLAVFATGMNDGSGTSNNYLTNRATFLSICEANGITPIFCTVPTVPTVNNEAKNEWVRESNYRYIDFAKAVGADANGNWYAGMLDTGESPAVHPTAKGARALYTQVLIDLPEIADI